MKNTIGILGGMGPAATADMFQKFIQFTDAHCDQEHIPLLISSIPDIPDRSSSLLDGGASPQPFMAKYIKGLEDAGASCILIACNTAHYWYENLKSQCHVDMISMIEATVNEVVKSGAKRVGLLATNATLQTKLYQNQLERNGLICVLPRAQQDVMDSIYLFKSGDVKQAEVLMNKPRDSLLEQDVDMIILGCTEVPIILAKEIKKTPQLYVDSTSALVRAAIKWYHTH
ncbi:amino acid racemase [Pasteurellaceae bacterium LIM206]|nr:amino acid racemase [Pasteurellaceae bacterium LIM206]